MLFFWMSFWTLYKSTLWLPIQLFVVDVRVVMFLIEFFHIFFTGRAYQVVKVRFLIYILG